MRENEDCDVTVTDNKMADDDKSPLLKLEEDEDEIDSPRRQIHSLFQRENNHVIEEEAINISGSNSASNLAEDDHIVAIFVVAFDTRSGVLQLQLVLNLLRVHCYPSER